MWVIIGSLVIEVCGGKWVSGVKVVWIDLQVMCVSGGEWLDCDLIVSFGGYSLVVYLVLYLGGKLEWCEEIFVFVFGEGLQKCICVGVVNGVFGFVEVFVDGYQVGSCVVFDVGYKIIVGSLLKVQLCCEEVFVVLFQVFYEKFMVCVLKQFVDLQNDVIVVVIELVCCEGFEFIEYVKCYIVLGFGIDQGKLGNINGLVIVVWVQGKSIVDIGIIMFCLNYILVIFGVVVGCYCGYLFELVCFIVLYVWYVKNGVEFEDVGQWKWLWYFLCCGEDMYVVVVCECCVVCEVVGLFDVLILGKIDIQGLDVWEFFNWVYINVWIKFDVGKVCYGLMCKEDGMVFDDGVIVCLVDNYFVMIIIIGGVVCVLEWLELYYQIEWLELKVYFILVIDYYVIFILFGLNSCKLFVEVIDIDLDKDVFFFMIWKEGKVVGVLVWVFCIFFIGELSYEVNVQVDYVMGVFEVFVEYGVKYGLMFYGIEIMYVLCVEKGFIIVGQDIDVLVILDDFNMGWVVGCSKLFFWIGWCGMNCVDCLCEDCK